MDLDYKKLGMKAGLEIHQQLDTKKLFCNCPSIIKDGNPDFTIKRRLRAIAGETGKIDVAAKHEFEKGKTFFYEGYYDTTCLVELDEEPPHDVNKEALKIAYEVALMLNSKIVDEIQVMRKTVVDGSNTAGFQRTALIATDGFIQTDKGKIKIPTICLEEDAAKIVSRDKEADTYNLSRLGISLIEIATDPDIKTPEQGKEVAEKIGMILRSTKKVKRGLGTIRQDVNISIKEGARIEIKGAQDLKLIPKLMKYEVLRQSNLLELKGEKLKISRITDISSIFKKTSSHILKTTIENNGKILGIKIENLKGLLGKELCPNKRLGTELSDYAKLKAKVSGLFHTDELPKYGITKAEVEKVNKKLKCNSKDAFVLIGDNEKVAEKALKAVIERLKMFTKGIPKEVRKANADGTTTFMRPMPGAARMYPETDVKTIKSDVKDIEVSELITDKVKKLKKEYDFKEGFSKQVLTKEELFYKFVNKYPNIKPMLIAEALVVMPKDIKKRHDIEVDIKYLDEIFDKLNKSEISHDSVSDILIELTKNKKVDYSKYKAANTKDLEAEIKKIIDEKPNLSFNAYMGLAMTKFKGKISGKEISDVIKKILKS
jgi:glutamyl-tRNA(Gln) amidotransferase subunit E